MLYNQQALTPGTKVLILEREGGGNLTGIKVRPNESIDSALKRFKRETSKAGLMAEIKKRKHYEKPSVIRKKKVDAAKRKRRKSNRESSRY